MPNWVVRCMHCFQYVRVESLAYDNACPICSNILPPQDLSNRVLPSRQATVGTTTESVSMEEKPAVPEPPPPPPVVEAELVTDDESGVDFGDVTLDDEA